MIPRFETAPHVVETPAALTGRSLTGPGIVHKASAPRGGYVSIPGLEILQYLYNSDNLGTKAVIPRVETAPHGVETPTPSADR